MGTGVKPHAVDQGKAKRLRDLGETMLTDS